MFINHLVAGVVGVHLNLRVPGARTYSSMRGGARGFVTDAVRLYKVRTRGIPGDVKKTLTQKAEVEAAYQSVTNSTLNNRSVLVIGTGQTKREVIALGVANQVIAIDLDVVPSGWHPASYLQLFRQNGPVRTAKTIGRKVLGIDRTFTRELCTSLGVGAPKAATYLQMDATKMTFAYASFDLVYSYSVFEHLPDPAAVLQEAKRVLKPGGVLYVSLHLYSAEGGCHDLRIFAGQRESIPYWAQLRPAVKDTVIESCYMNEWPMARWNELFRAECPGAMFSIEQHHQPYATQLEVELKRLRAAGELADYADEEVLAVNLRYVWSKPES